MFELNTRIHQVHFQPVPIGVLLQLQLFVHPYYYLLHGLWVIKKNWGGGSHITSGTPIILIWIQCPKRGGIVHLFVFYLSLHIPL